MKIIDEQRQIKYFKLSSKNTVRFYGQGSSFDSGTSINAGDDWLTPMAVAVNQLKRLYWTVTSSKDKRRQS